jgi:hypothetical protein
MAWTQHIGVCERLIEGINHTESKIARHALWLAFAVKVIASVMRTHQS